MKPRAGTSLATTLCLLVLIECVVLGTLHLALLETRLAAGAATALRLRLGARAALAEAVRHWPAEPDASGGAPLWTGSLADGLRASADLLPAGEDMYVLRAYAYEPPPMHGRAAVAMLVRPPLLPADFDPAQHPDSGDAGSCDAAVPSVVRRLLAAAPRVGERPGVTLLAVDARVDSPLHGVVIAAGDVRLTAAAKVDGVLFAAGTVELEAGAELTGAILAPCLRGAAAAVHPDADVAFAAIRGARLQQPEPVPGRFLVPGF